MAFDRNSVNKALLLGRCGNDPDVRSLPSGGNVVTISIATTSGWRDQKTNENKERTEWHRVVFFGRIADTVSQYVRKGSLLYVEGSLRTNEYEKDGIKRYSTDIVADKMTMLGSKNDRSDTQAPSTQAPNTQAPSAQAPNTQAPNTQAPSTQMPSATPVSSNNTGMKPAPAPAPKDIPEDDLEDDIPF